MRKSTGYDTVNVKEQQETTFKRMLAYQKAAERQLSKRKDKQHMIRRG